MHDPNTIAFAIPYPWPKGRNRRYRSPFITIWHRDPETDGSDDSCGWFMRGGHGDKKVLEKIAKRFEEDWDKVYIPRREDHDETEDGPYKPNVYFRGYFTPDGDPHMSAHGIVLNLFFVACGVVFERKGRRDWNRSKRFMRKHLFDILMFAENPVDSLFDAINRTFEIATGEKISESARKERVLRMAGVIYGWILRAQRNWYRHPRWHVWHWRVQVHPLQLFKRWAFSRCDLRNQFLQAKESKPESPQPPT